MTWPGDTTRAEPARVVRRDTVSRGLAPPPHSRSEPTTEACDATLPAAVLATTPNRATSRAARASRFSRPNRTYRTEWVTSYDGQVIDIGRDSPPGIQWPAGSQQ